jgi:hypothetical protein
LSNFHGGDLVGEPIRILMKRGKEIFEKVREPIERMADERENNLATRSEIQESVFEEVEMDEDRAPLTPPRISKKRKLKSIKTIRNIGL